ncbi:MAG: tetratricopeptide repeat protein [Hyphomicrobiaceae bacterium]
MLSQTFRSLILAAAGVALSASVLSGMPPEAPESREDRKASLLGGYLAGRFARAQYDTASALEFYRAALTHLPDNEVLLDHALTAETAEGNWPQAIELARKLAAGPNTHRMAHLVLGIAEAKAQKWKEADDHFRLAALGPLAELTGALARGWIKLAEGNVDAALEALQVPRPAAWMEYFLRYHRALIADLGHRQSEARTAYERIFKSDARSARTVLAYARHAAHAGDIKLAKSILKDHQDRINQDRAGHDGHPLIRALRDDLNANAQVKLLVETPADGLTELFYILGEYLNVEGSIPLATTYLQFALYFRPDFPSAAAILATVYESTKRYALALRTYDRIVKGTPLQPILEIRKALNLNALERVDEAKVLLEAVAAADPADIRPLEALATMMRQHKRYKEAIHYYTRAIALIPKPEKRHWTYWHYRGTCHERDKNWTAAELDLQKALQLHPDEPLTLNYLGYSWVDQNRNLRQGMALIEKAVALKPEDGFIVDSLGWAHYRLANYKEAVIHLERAVELTPYDPVLNDHLGDALWRVGRRREARFQWEQALTLKPEPEDLEKIKQKIENGLSTPRPIVRRPKKGKETARGDLQKRVERKAAPAPAR